MGFACSCPPRRPPEHPRRYRPLSRQQVQLLVHDLLPGIWPPFRERLLGLWQAGDGARRLPGEVDEPRIALGLLAGSFALNLDPTLEHTVWRFCAVL